MNTDALATFQTPPTSLESVREASHSSRGAAVEVKRKSDLATMSYVCMPNPSYSFQILSNEFSL